MEYDSKADTLLHIKRVNQLLTEAASELIRRANVHDNSKLESPEKELFDAYTPKLKNCTYGSDEYKEFLKGLKVALDHHYKNNSHHPEHYENGVNGFDLFDLIEMFFDWKAATERHADGDIIKSIEINKGRFELSEQLCDIMRNTALRLGSDDRLTDEKVKQIESAIIEAENLPISEVRLSLPSVLEARQEADDNYDDGERWTAFVRGATWVMVEANKRKGSEA